MSKRKKSKSRNLECDCSALNQKNYWCGLSLCPNCNRPIRENQLGARRDLLGPDGVVWMKGGGRPDTGKTALRRLEIIKEGEQDISISGIAEMLQELPDTPESLLPEYFVEFYEARKKQMAEAPEKLPEYSKGGLVLGGAKKELFPGRLPDEKSEAPIDSGAKRQEGETLDGYKARRGLS